MQVLVTKEQRAESKEQKTKHIKLYFFHSMLLALCLLLIFIYGCGPGYFLKAKTDVSKIKKIAVLPLENFTSDEYANEKVRTIVITELLSRDIEVIEPGEVTRVLRDLTIKSIGSVKIAELQEIGRRLKSDSLMMGSVESFQMSRGISVTYPEATINLRLIEVSTGNIIWAVRHTTGGANFWTRHFGSETASLGESADKVVKEAIDTLF